VIKPFAGHSDEREQPTLAAVKAALLSLGDVLQEAEAIGLFGSLVREGAFSERSDIDVFVVVRQKAPGGQTDQLWWRRVKRVLEPFERDVTVLVYTVSGLEKICNWYVLRLASEGVLVYDKGDIAELFRRIIATAEEAGFYRKPIGDTWVWAASRAALGKVIEVKAS